MGCLFWVGVCLNMSQIGLNPIFGLGGAGVAFFWLGHVGFCHSGLMLSFECA